MSRLIDITGNRYGKLTVLRRADGKSGHNIRWECLCDCGNTVVVSGGNLKNGHTESCGCLYKEAAQKRLIDLTGKRFGRLVVLHRIERKGRVSYWRCKCDCGNEKDIWLSSLTREISKSCGCLSRELTGARSKKHGKTGTRIYRIWQAMRRRCYEESNPAYRWYGLRGISVCEEWRHAYETFEKWALANGYANNLSIDRIDNNGNYCPENCRWATMAEQANNTRKNHCFDKDGRKLTLSECARELGCSESIILHRLQRGWDEYRAITEPSVRINWKIEPEECKYPGCNEMTTLSTGFCKKHHHRQKTRVQFGRIKDLYDFSLPDTGKGFKKET